MTVFWSIPCPKIAWPTAIVPLKTEVTVKVVVDIEPVKVAADGLEINQQ
jgi:hypothetical protein